jgi:prephenate dehydrogenase
VRPSSLAVVGLGAIGGSLAWQARVSGVARVVGYSPRRAEGIQALKAGAISVLADSAEEAANSAELVVLAVPPQATLDLLAPISKALQPGAVLTDVCSIKEAIVSKAMECGTGDRFAGSHPLAGTHESGFQSARPDLLRGCVVYICATSAPNGYQAASTVTGFWEQILEASPVLIEAAAHDRQLAWTSHLPQSVAYTLAWVLAGQGLAGVSFGQGARDTMRLAASNPEMWTEILLLNREAVVPALEQLRAGVGELQQLLTAEDRASLLQYFEAAQNFRLGIER